MFLGYCRQKTSFFTIYEKRIALLKVFFIAYYVTEVMMTELRSRGVGACVQQAP